VQRLVSATRQPGFLSEKEPLSLWQQEESPSSMHWSKPFMKRVGRRWPLQAMLAMKISPPVWSRKHWSDSVDWILPLITPPYWARWGQYGSRNIRVNALLPGGTDTEMAKEFASTPEEAEFVANLHALKRIAQPEEIAKSALYLASDASSFTTGSALLVDGGISINRI